MNIYAQEIFKRHFQFVLFVLLSLVCGLSILFNLKISAKLNEPILIAIDANGTRVVTSSTDPIFNTEALQFLQRFISNVYNFDSQNFLKRIGLATTMMSEGLWKSKRTEILELKSRVEADEISLVGKVMKITKDQAGVYHALIDGIEKSRLNKQGRKIKLSIGLNSVPRTTENPWGLEVSTYEEELVR